MGRERLARGLGGELSTGVPRTLAEAVDESTAGERPVPVAIVDEGDGWSVAVEPFGGQGVRRGVLRGLAGKRQALSLAWNVNMDVLLAYAEDGQVFHLADAGPLVGWPDRMRELVTVWRATRAGVIVVTFSGRTITPEVGSWNQKDSRQDVPARLSA